MIKFLQITLFICLPFISTSQTVVLEVRAYAQGFYSSTLGEMVPVADPINNPTLCDTASIVLIDSSSGQSVFCDQVAFSTTGYGTSTLPSSLFGNSYRVGVRFRNTLHVVSLNTLLLDSTNKSIDLTIAANLCCSFDTTFGVATAYSGDVNLDGTVDVTDITIIDNDQSLGVTGYVITDINGDGIVDNADVNIAADNNTLLLFDDYTALCLPTGIASGKTNSLSASAFPNPFSEHFSINLPGTYQQIDVLISDALGKAHYSKHFTAENKLDIQTDKLPSGIYFVQVIADGKKVVLKLLSY